MFESWFYKRCMTLVGSNGRRLVGEAMEQAEATLNEAKLAGYKVWADENGLMFKKAPGLLSKAERMIDKQGNPLHICGHLVHVKANYCSKCTADAPDGWWRCGECGKPVGNDSSVCPHCGHHLNPVIRADISTGSWVQRDGVFAERFDLADVNVLLPYGINIQENQRGLMLEGGELTKVMTPGHYACENFRSEKVKQYGEHAIVFVDLSEFSLPLRVSGVYTKESMTCDVHIQLTLQFDPENGNAFLCNLMRNRLTFEVGDACPATLGYDEIMEKLLQTTDDVVRRFCIDKSVDTLFESADVRVDLELEIMRKLAGQLHSMGLRLVRLGELEFKSEVFDKLRVMKGDIETTRRRNEFIFAADKLADDATMKGALRRQEVEDYLADLAQRGEINAGQREQAMKRIRRQWAFDDVMDEMTREYDLNLAKLARSSNLTMEQMTAKSKEEMQSLVYSYNLKDEDQRREAKLRLQKINDDIKELDTRHAAELRRVLEDTQNEYDKMLISEQLENVKGRIEESEAARKRRIKEAEEKLANSLRLEKERVEITIFVEWQEAKQKATEGWIRLKDIKNKVEGDNLDRNAERESRMKDADVEREIKIKDAETDRLIKLKNADTDNMVRGAQGVNGMDLFAIIAAAKDPSTRDKLVEAHLGEIERRMKPEVILAAMAKRGNDEALAKIDRLDEEHRKHLEKTVEDNRQMYQTVMNMNERMFNQMTEKMTRPSGGSVATTNVIKQD